MKKTPSLPDFDINSFSTRLAKESDIPDLVSIAKTIWDGGDYLPKVMREWINEPWFIVGEQAGRVIACIKLTLLPVGSLWFEGMRVHGSHQGRGIGKLMNRAAMETAAQIAKRHPGLSFEFSTYFLNHETLHLTAKMGFKQVEGFHTMDKFGTWLMQEPELITAPGMDIFDLYPSYLPVGWRAIRKSEEALAYIRDHARVFATPKARYLIGGHGSGDVTILDPIPGNFKSELPYLQHFFGRKRKYSIIFPRSMANHIPKLEKLGYRFWDDNPESKEEMLVFSMPAETALS